MYELKLPDIGEGIAEGEILKWLVKVGDKVNEEQPLVEVMTDKVNVQIPSPRTGTVTGILAKEGDVVKVGQVILVIDSGSAEQSAPKPTEMTPRHAAASAQPPLSRARPSLRRGGARHSRDPEASARDGGRHREGAGLGHDGKDHRGRREEGRVGGRRATSRMATTPAVSVNEERIPLRGLRRSSRSGCPGRSTPRPRLPTSMRST